MQYINYTVTGEQVSQQGGKTRGSTIVIALTAGLLLLVLLSIVGGCG